MSEKFINPEHPIAQAELARKEDEIRQMIKSFKATAEEVKMAYEQALGIPIEKTVREEVFQLAQKIDELTRDGLPLNRVTDLVEGSIAFEGAPDTYYALVGSLDVTEKEKSILRSIVEKKRAGELVIYSPKKEEELATCKIKKNDGKNDQYERIVAQELAKFLYQFKGEKIEITFSES